MTPQETPNLIKELSDQEFINGLINEATFGMLPTNDQGPLYTIQDRNGNKIRSRFILAGSHGYEVLTWRLDERAGVPVCEMTTYYHSGIIVTESPYRFPCTFVLLCYHYEFTHLNRMHQQNIAVQKDLDAIIGGNFKFEELIAQVDAIDPSKNGIPVGYI